ncbi:hypothetical protein BHC54_04320 [Snodgrassella alvi]|uniref:Uncharacterized protein n=1 Tax=Snodgrassella alvi TaxID=1196083 RepID=A0A2N9X7X7_9NEIS|nr:hypothetical protein BHC54_04320 [Snodgrassella alvi]
MICAESFICRSFEQYLFNQHWYEIVILWLNGINNYCCSVHKLLIYKLSNVKLSLRPDRLLLKDLPAAFIDHICGLTFGNMFWLKSVQSDVAAYGVVTIGRM